MRGRERRVQAGFCTILTLFLLTGTVQANDKSIVIGSGGTTGVYYPVAVSICRLFNAENAANGYRCTVESTGGSVDNLTRLRGGGIDFAIVQSDWQAHARNGTDVFAEPGPHEQLRSVLALYSESFTVLASAKSFIAKFEDLLGRRVNIGNPGSGQRATMEVVMDAFGWSRFSFSLIREFDSKRQADALCDGEVDVIVFVAGHPSGSIKSATEKCEAKLVEVAGPIIDKLVDENDFYRTARIPAGMYRKQPGDVPTFGVNATLVTTTEAPAPLVDLLMKSVLGNLDKFKRMHPALGDLQEEEMMRDIMPAPLHDGAKRYAKLTQN